VKKDSALRASLNREHINNMIKTIDYIGDGDIVQNDYTDDLRGGTANIQLSKSYKLPTRKSS